MSRAKPVRPRRKGAISENAQHVKHLLADLQRAAAGVPKLLGEISVRGPVYAASAGLAFVYGWGFLSTFPLAFAVGAIGVVVMGEFLKPRLLELIEDRLRDRAWAKAVTLVVAAALCVAIGAAGGFLALNAAQAAQARYDAAVAARVEPLREIASIDGQIRALPPIPSSVPAERIVQLRAARADDIAALERLKPALPALPERPAVSVPAVHWGIKLAVIAAIEFVIFVVPWGSRRAVGEVKIRLGDEALTAPKSEAAGGAAPARVNDGGWATRRARYGASGRKPPRRFGVVKGGKS